MRIVIVFCCLLCSIFSFSQKSLHIYGGKDHDVYLGCLNCSKYDQNSIWNQYGTYGSKYNASSIWNKYGDYGGKYSDTSPFNPYASTPPVIVDKDGGFYGYFTVNTYKDKRADFKLVLTIYKYHDEIADDVVTWYDKLFE